MEVVAMVFLDEHSRSFEYCISDGLRNGIVKFDV
jgi:hypothetical protein